MPINTDLAKSWWNSKVPGGKFSKDERDQLKALLFSDVFKKAATIALMQNEGLRNQLDRIELKADNLGKIGQLRGQVLGSLRVIEALIDLVAEEPEDEGESDAPSAP